MEVLTVTNDECTANQEAESRIHSLALFAHPAKATSRSLLDLSTLEATTEALPLSLELSFSLYVPSLFSLFYNL